MKMKRNEKVNVVRTVLENLGSATPEEIEAKTDGKVGGMTIYTILRNELGAVRTKDGRKFKYSLPTEKAGTAPTDKVEAKAVSDKAQSILDAMTQAAGDRAEAAKILNITRKQLSDKLYRLNKKGIEYAQVA